VCVCAQDVPVLFPGVEHTERHEKVQKRLFQCVAADWPVGRHVCVRPHPLRRRVCASECVCCRSAVRRAAHSGPVSGVLSASRPRARCGSSSHSAPHTPHGNARTRCSSPDTHKRNMCYTHTKRAIHKKHALHTRNTLHKREKHTRNTLYTRNMLLTHIYETHTHT